MESMGSLSTPTLQPLAVVGMACRLPGNSNSPTALWRFLEQGGIASNEPPASRFNLRGHEDGTKRNKTMRSPGGMFLENIDPADIDAQFFGLSRAEAIAMDPQQRQLLEVVYEGLENAGITLESLDGQPVGCFVGSYASDWGDIHGRDPEDRVPNATVGVGRAMLSNRLSHFLNTKGPSMTIDTACSGSLVSLDVASRYLQTREIDAAIVAACNLYMSPEHNIDMSNLSGAASLSGRCHTFDVKADGYIKSEAVNMVFIKRLSDALQARDPIRAIIRGSATNSDGWTAGIASPSPEAQASATRQAYMNAGITDLNSTTYVECHGTGTRAGDPVEVNSVASVFCATRSSNQPLLIGSIKSNIGHSEPAAGISGMIKTILALEKGIIPGNPTFKTPNPAIDFEGLKVCAFQRSVPWPEVPLRRASVNSYGYGGSNVHVILDEAKTGVPPSETAFKSSYLMDDDDPFADDVHERPQLLVFSANDEWSLKEYVQSLQKHLINPGVQVSLADLAYTLSERRSRHFYRAYLVSESSTLDPHGLIYGKPLPSIPRVGFVFTGQGSQWPQMGKMFIDTFPSSKRLLGQLDSVLQGLPHPPKWSLQNELTRERSSDHVRQAEFSQPLITALQLIILDILKSWGVQPTSVVGHSSGEIAASVAAGYLSPAEAIQVAYYRGKAAVDLHDESRPKLGMLAVALGETSPLLHQVIEHYPGLVYIACVNSPESVTLSGYVSVLVIIAQIFQGHDCFARLLHVDLAYHTVFMEHIATHYKQLLDARLLSPSCICSQTKMFSSVTGEHMKGSIDSEYWKANMQSPVLFSRAVQAMMTDTLPPDFLIEVGPSGALAGPVKQILKALPGNGSHVEYHAACKRADSGARALFDIAGKLFLAGGSVELSDVNAHVYSSNRPSVIVDLPNYSWNHTTKYWWESKSSKDWRFRRYPNHDLLGGRVLGTPWIAPVWKKVLRLSELPWLQDHQIGGQILFPASGYIAMAVEAFFQTSQSRGFVNSFSKVHDLAYRLRNVKFVKAMVLEEGIDQRLMLTLIPEDEHAGAWSRFVILTLHDDDTTTSHCSGLISLEDRIEEDAPINAVKPLQYPVPSQAWYKALRGVGYSFGPSFQSQLQIETVAGKRCNRALISFVGPSSPFPESPYSVHPVAIDGCLQSGAPSLWQGIRSAIGCALVPAIIGDLFINAHNNAVKTGISVASSEYAGVGSRNDAHNYVSQIQVYNCANRKLLIDVRGLSFHKLDAEQDFAPEHTFMHLVWKPDISTLTKEQMHDHLKVRHRLSDNDTHQRRTSLFELLLHKRPSLQVVEFSTLPFSESIGLDLFDTQLCAMKGTTEYHFMANDATTLLASREVASNFSNLHMSIVDVTRPAADLSILPDKMNLVILRMGYLCCRDLKHAIANAKSVLDESGYLLVLWNSRERSDDMLSQASSCGSSDSGLGQIGDSHSEVAQLLRENGFQRVVPIASEHALGEPSGMAIFGKLPRRGIVQVPCASPEVALLHLSQLQKPICQELATSGIVLTEHFLSQQSISAGSVVLIIDELYSPILTDVTQVQWETIQQLAACECKIMWITSGAQLDVTEPHSALVCGMSRVMRAEDPSLSFTLFDVESATSPHSINAIRDMVLWLQEGQPSFLGITDNEFIERKGVIYISRIYPDPPLHTSHKETMAGPVRQTRNLHQNPSCVRLVCRQPGMLHSICFEEVSPRPVVLPDDFVEVDMHAAGLNYKDVATALGIVPENQYKLGLEGAGVVCRIGKRVTSLHVGQRVVVNRRGSFGNKVQCPIEAVHAIPHWMTFEEAATLPVVYLSVINGLFDLANLQMGQSVLIHSAAGGVGLAAIQICQYVGAKIYVTVGSDQKKKFLSERFKIPPERIYSSRNREFASRIMEATNGWGIDVILNTLTGKLLDESWRIIAPCGIMVELGKRDVLDRKSLSMEPFNRNASYRALDMSHRSITRQDTARLMRRMFDLLHAGHIKPIEPRTVFPYSDIAGAIRYMRGGAHMGKIIISRDCPDSNPEVAIVSARKEFHLRRDKAYLIVGGLKGLCGSLAVYLARHGAKHLVIMSRRGYDDNRSQGIIRDLSSLGARCELVKGDVSIKDDIRRALRQSRKPIGGIIQGALVLRDRTYTAMTVEQFHEVLSCKVTGSWNLHEVAVELNLQLEFFTLLSSLSGLIGQKGQANYAAANTFLDSLAIYRHQQGLPACAVDLGVIEDVGYVSEHQSIANRFDMNIWTPINEALLHRILRVSIIGQYTSPHIITGVAFPQPANAVLLQDPRFTTLTLLPRGDAQDVGSGDRSRDVQTLLSLVRATTDLSEQLTATIEVVNRHFMRSLGLTEPMESAKPLSVYGLDSLAAVDFRNWMRQELNVTISTLDVISAKTLSALCEKIVARLQKA